MNEAIKSYRAAISVSERFIAIEYIAHISRDGSCDMAMDMVPMIQHLEKSLLNIHIDSNIIYQGHRL